jgi:hypothetical protein
MPEWLVTVSWIAIAVGVVCALVVLADIFLAGHRQHMWIMDVVWPLTALYSGPLGLWAYFSIGRLSTHEAMMAAKKSGEEPPAKKKPFWQMTLVGATHCGAGCTLGDLIAEWFVFAVPVVLFGHKIFGGWLVDFVAAYVLGIVFQFFTIAPMRGLSFWPGVGAAIKADSASLTAWQVGMYGWMAIATFAIFGREIEQTSPVFWFMMQIGMLAGFLTAYPVNWWLLRAGLKEKM